MTLKITQENTLIDLPALNCFQIGDQVVVDASADNDRFEGTIIGIELRRPYASGYLEPCITILHDGYITDGFKPIDCRKASTPAPQHNVVGRDAPEIERLQDENRELRAQNRHLRSGRPRALHKPPNEPEQAWQKRHNAEISKRRHLSSFLEALDEWGTEDNDERAKAILDFQAGGYDLNAYREENIHD